MNRQTRTAIISAHVDANRRARAITRLTGIRVGIDRTGTDLFLVWVDGERIGPIPVGDLTAVLDGVEQSARCLADARETAGAA